MNPEYIDYVTSTHHLYDRYRDDWKLCINSYYGGVEYKRARYLRAYAVDQTTPGETISTYLRNPDGTETKVASQLQIGTSQYNSQKSDQLDGSFYGEKLENTPLYNYVKLIASEYNAILFRNPPHRKLPETDVVKQFIHDVDGEGNNINEFWSQVDILSTVYGVCHVSCIKPAGSDIPQFKVHSPLEITNWKYTYNNSGALVLASLVMQLEDSEEHKVYRYITPDSFDTVFVGADEDYTPPEIDGIEQIDETTWRVTEPNELGYIPVRTIYQSQKVYNNIGTTTVQDVAQIQRSIYGYMAEIYAAISYGAHPTLVVDEETETLNDGKVGAEPGSVVRVKNTLGGEPNYVYEFRSPSLDAISEIQDLIDNQVNKLSQIAMLRSEDLIKSSRSGEQIEQYDDKLSAVIRKKATNLENAEHKLWDVWFDWLNTLMPADFQVSYNRQYNKRALEQEINELKLLMNVIAEFEQHQQPVTESASEFEPHWMYHPESGEAVWAEVEQDHLDLTDQGYHHGESDQPGMVSDTDQEFIAQSRRRVRERLAQILDASSSENGL